VAFTSGIFFKIETVTDEAASAGIGDAVPDGGIRWRVADFSGSAAMDDDFVATLHNENVFHGTTAADSCSDQL
jgi:hypothetical protein